MQMIYVNAKTAKIKSFSKNTPEKSEKQVAFSRFRIKV